MKKLYYIHTYGCQMNVHDSEKIAGILCNMGYSETSDINIADVVVFNTCCIRDTAEKKIFGNIGELKHRKAVDKSFIIAVVGCMTQQEGMKEILVKKFPFIDIILGTNNFESIGEKIHEILDTKTKKRPKIYERFDIQRPEIREDIPVYRTSGTNAWINIMYGCDNFCTYCIVPYVRGRERSREPESIIKEFKSLIAEGYKEITLLGQNVDSYGNDRNDDWNFAKLLKELVKVEGKYRVRFMTSHPKDLSDEVIDIIASNKNICNNIHLPVQAGSNNVLKAMNRKYTREKYLELISKIKEKMPDCGITSDIMVGFPGETEEDFMDTLDLVAKVRFSNAFTFIYSPRKGTVAAKMEQIPYCIKKERITKLIDLQNAITKEISDTYVGKTLEVLIEDAPKPGFLCGRTESGRLVNFPGNPEIVGNFVNIKITKSKASALWGEIDE